MAGLEVLHQRRTSNEIVVARLYLLGGARQITSSDAGIEPMLLHASAYGTSQYPGAAARYALARTGSSVSVHAGDDWSTISLFTVRAALDSAWMVFSDRIVAPRLEPADVERVRRQMLAGVLMSDGDPDALVARLAREYGFAGHPYANDPNGTDQSLRRISVEQLRAYHAAQFVTSRMLLVVAGNVDSATVHDLAAKTIAALPSGSYVWTDPPKLEPRPSAMAIVPRKLESDYVIGVFPGPLASSAEYGPFRLVTASLGSRIHVAVREKKQLSYAAGAPMYDNAATAGAIYVSTTQPERALELMIEQMESIASRLLSPDGLPDFVMQFSIESLLDQEANGDYASAMARGHLVFGDFRAVDAPYRALFHHGVLGERGSKIQDWPAARWMLVSVQARLTAQRHMGSIQWVFVGDTSRFRKYLQ